MKRLLTALFGLTACTCVGAEPALDQCRQRVIDYAYFWDHDDGAGFADLFTADATLTLGGNTFSGRDAIVERMMANGPVLRHLMSTVRVTAVDAGSARGVSYVTVYAAEPVADGLPSVDGFALLGEYHDTFVIDATGCRISERRLVPVMRQARAS
ncbi:MAG: nuclear transport factor 2 family protein [Pseudomonadales bacterium]